MSQARLGMGMTAAGLAAVIVGALLWAAPARAGTADARPWNEWQAPLLKDHALVGKVWSKGTSGFVSPDALAEAVRSARFVLLGEVHDNADAHRLQAWLLTRAAEGRKPPVVFEMIPRDYADKLKTYLTGGDASAEGLGAALDWEKRGWPDWKIYEPIAAVALDRSLELRAGDLPKSSIRALRTKGLKAVAPKRLAALRLDTPLDAPLNDALLDELFDSHCQLMPREALSPMAGVQRLRDAVLAESMLGAAGGGSAILIAGNGHVRSDRAVPYYLKQHDRRADIVSVMMIEVADGADAPEDLMPKGPDGTAAADFAWFVPRAEREDQCAALRKHFEKKKR